MERLDRGMRDVRAMGHALWATPAETRRQRRLQQCIREVNAVTAGIHYVQGMLNMTGEDEISISPTLGEWVHAHPSDVIPEPIRQEYYRSLLREYEERGRIVARKIESYKLPSEFSVS